MTHTRHFRFQPHLVLVFAAFVLAACAGSNDPAPTATVNPETVLRNNTAALQKTILEGALAGAGTGSGIGFTIGGKKGARTGLSIGTTVGLTAGSYVAFIQRKYILKESKLDRVIEDLQNNNALLTATLASMQAVVAKNRAELAAAAALAPEEQAREKMEAQENLAQMQNAVARASSRQAEFAPVRSLELVGKDGRTPDAELQILADRIAQMRAVAAEMQSLL